MRTEEAHDFQKRITSGTLRKYTKFNPKQQLLFEYNFGI